MYYLLLLHRNIGWTESSWMLCYKHIVCVGIGYEGMEYEMIYQFDAIEYLFVFFQLDMFRAYSPIFRGNGCYNFFTYAAYGVL